MNNTPLLSELGQRLSNHRSAKGLHAQDIAEQIGIHRNTYRRLEKGEGSIENLINALIAIDEREMAENLIPELTTLSPMKALSSLGGTKKTASKRYAVSEPAVRQKTTDLKRRW